eukprot:11495620-Prorocentrum_lima.AAC.1
MSMRRLSKKRSLPLSPIFAELMRQAKALRFRTQSHHAQCTLCANLRKSREKALAKPERTNFQRDLESHLRG